MKTLLLLAALIPSLASAQKAALVIDQTTPIKVECVTAVPDSVRDPAAKEDPGTLYKIVEFQDEKAVAKMAETLGYNLVSCAAPVVTADKTSKVTVTTKAHACECAPVGGTCLYAPVGAGGKPGKAIAAPQDTTFQSGTLTGCVPVRTVCVELYGFPSLPNACRTKPFTKGEVAPVEGEVKPK